MAHETLKFSSIMRPRNTLISFCYWKQRKSVSFHLPWDGECLTFWQLCLSRRHILYYPSCPGVVILLLLLSHWCEVTNLPDTYPGFLKQAMKVPGLRHTRKYNLLVYMGGEEENTFRKVFLGKTGICNLQILNIKRVYIKLSYLWLRTEYLHR